MLGKFQLLALKEGVVASDNFIEGRVNSMCLYLYRCVKIPCKSLQHGKYKHVIISMKIKTKTK
jgi:hypothetical protein